MAACTARAATASTANATSYASGSFTPAASDLLVAFVVHTAGSADPTPTMTDSQGLGFTLINVAAFASDVDGVYLFVANALAAASSMTVTFNCASSGTPSGAVIFVCSVSGMSKTGSAAVKQSAKQANQASGGTPAPAFGAAALTTNPTLGVVGNLTNPATLTPPASWTEDLSGDAGYATPTAGAEWVFRNSGFTGTTITWGSTSASVFGDIIVELDTSALSFLPRPERVVLQAVNRSSVW